MCPYFIFYKPCFLFLGSFDQNLRLGSASMLAFLRQSPSACQGILKLIMQRGWCVWVWVWHMKGHCPFTRVSSSLGAWEGLVPHQCLAGCGDTALWAQSCEVGHWKKPPFERLFAALGREQGKRQLLCKSFVAVRNFATESSFPLTGILWSQKGNADVSKR